MRRWCAGSRPGLICIERGRRKARGGAVTLADDFGVVLVQQLRFLRTTLTLR